MRFFVFFWGFGAFFCLTSICRAQVNEDTVIHMLEPAVIQVRGEKEDAYTQDQDETLSFSLSNTLSAIPGMQVRSNGASSLSTLSIRGGTPEQSPIFWNGLSIQNNTNGVSDLSLLPSFFFDEIALNPYQSVGRGSGSIAGSLGLNNSISKWDSMSNIQVEWGQFGKLATMGKLGFQIGKTTHQTKFLLSSNKNAYPFLRQSTAQGEIYDTLTNAKFDQWVVMHQARFYDKNGGRPLSVRVWIQQSNREIPPTLFEAKSNKSQDDNVIRLQGDKQFKIAHGDLRVNAGYFREALIYRDFDTFSYLSNTATALIHYVHELSARNRIALDLESRWFHADGDTFYNRSRQEGAVAIHYDYRGWVEINSGLRVAGYSNFKSSPILYQFKIRKRFSNSVIGFHLSSNYRIPTFNNLYWRPGGNPNLIPEKSHFQELFIRTKRRKWELDLRVFSTFIQNQITWLPTSKGYFEAIQETNQQRWNRGVEIRIPYQSKRLLAGGSANYTNTAEILANGSIEETQASYVPLWQMAFYLGYKSRLWSIRSNIRYQSSRSLPSNSTLALEPFWLMDLRADLSLKQSALFLSWENCFNANYYEVISRPMPPSRLSLGLRYLFKNPGYKTPQRVMRLEKIDVNESKPIK